MEEKLKMYVWDNVLTDYTSGMICILAHDLGEAFLIARKDAEFSENALKEMETEPKVYENPKAVLCYGGG